MKRIALVAVGFLVLAGFIGFLVRLPDSGGANAEMARAPSRLGVDQGGVVHDLAVNWNTTNATTTTTTGTVPGSTTYGVSAGGSTGGGGAGGSGGGGSFTGGGGFDSGSGGQLLAVAGSTGLQQGEVAGPRVVKTAQLSLVTKRHDFQNAFDRAAQIADLYHGFVASSSTQGVRSRIGRLTIRVPASSFQSALQDLRSLGRVEGQAISGQDVTAQYVDLQARLRNWQSQERALLKLMGRATTIGQTLRIQNELSSVQMRIEELKGQLRVLDDQTDLATIEMSMRESGVPAAPPVHHEQSGGLMQALRDARHGFAAVLAAVVVGLGYLVPIALLLALIWLGVRRLRPRIAA
ncbi:MAG: DUF4349 domain-containing protein [Actinomycetota bacterium]